MTPSEFLRQICPHRCWAMTIAEYRSMYETDFDRHAKPLLYEISWNPITWKSSQLEYEDTDYVVILFIGRQRHCNSTFLYFFMKNEGAKPTQDQAIRFLLSYIEHNTSRPAGLDPNDTAQFLQHLHNQPGWKDLPVSCLDDMHIRTYYANKLYDAFNAMFCFDLPKVRTEKQTYTARDGSVKEFERTVTVSATRPVAMIELFKKYCGK